MRRYTFKLYPNVAQAAALEDQRRLHSALYNGLIEQRISAMSRPALQWSLAPVEREIQSRSIGMQEWMHFKRDDKWGYGWRFVKGWVRKGKILTAFDQGKELTVLRAELPEYGALSRGSLEQTVKRVDLAFKAFFSRAKQGAGASSGFPRFKRCEGFGFRELSKGGWQLETRPDARGNRVFAEARRVRFQAVPGWVRVRGRFPGVPEQVRTCELMLKGGDWWLSVVVELPARLRADERNSGEIRLDLVDVFARVSRAGGPYGAGSEETVYTAADGRIILPSEGVSSGSGAVPPGMEGERRRNLVTSRPFSGAVPPGMEGERRDPARGDALACGAVPPETEGERRDPDSGRLAPEGAVPPETSGDRLSVVEELQRRMSLCKRNSYRYRQLRRLKQRHELRIARQRRENLHLWTTQIARQFESLSIVMPKVKEATASGKGDEREWGAAVEVKAALNRRVLNQAPALAAAMLAYKLAERGGEARIVEDEAPDVAVGADLVTGGKVLRKARRIIKREGVAT